MSKWLVFPQIMINWCPGLHQKIYNIINVIPDSAFKCDVENESLKPIMDCEANVTDICVPSASTPIGDTGKEDEHFDKGIFEIL